MPLRQLFSFRNAGFTGVTPKYSAVSTEWQWSTTEASVRHPWLVAGAFCNLRVVLTAAPGAGETITITLRVNGVDTAMQVVISDLAAVGISSDAVDVSPGDIVSLRLDNTLSSDFTAKASLEFVSDDEQESGYAGSCEFGVQERIPLLNPGDVPHISAASLIHSLSPIDATITGLSVLLSVAPGGATARTYRIHKNSVAQDGTGGTPDTTIAIAGASTTGSATFSLDIVPGDILTLEEVKTGSPATAQTGFAVVMVADNAGESVFCGYTGDSTPQAGDGTQYNSPAATNSVENWSAIESDREIDAGLTTFTLRQMYVRLTPFAPGTGDSLVFTLRKNASSPGGGPTVTIANSATTGNDAVGTVDIDPGDTFSLQCQPVNAPGFLIRSSWAWVLYSEEGIDGGGSPGGSPEDPVVITGPVSDVTQSTATLNGIATGDAIDLDAFFRWGTENPPVSNDTSPADAITTPDSFSAPITGLVAGQRYYYRAVATLVGSPATEFLGEVLFFDAGELGSFDEVLEGQPGVLSWMEWQRRDVTVGSPILQMVTNYYSDQDLQDPAEYYGGFKEARVMQFGEIARAFSDKRTGDWKGSSCRITLSDFDRTIRTRAASSGQKFWTTSVVAVRMVSRPTRAVLGTPLTVFVGPIRKTNPVPPLAYEIELQDQVGQFLTSQLQVPQRLVDSNFVGFSLVDAALSHPEPIIYGEHNRAEGAFEPIYLGNDSGDHTWLVAGHACHGITDIFINGSSVLGDVGTDWTIQKSVDLGGRRYCLLRGNAGNTNPDAAADGSALLRINVNGVETIGDGTGVLVTELLEQYKHWCVNYLSSMDGYQTGNWPSSSPTWELLDVTVPIVDVPSFDRAAAHARTRYGVAGYIGKGIIGATRNDRLAARDWIGRWNLSADVRFGVKRYGQMFVRMTQPTAADKEAAPLFTDVNDILEASYSVDTKWDEQFNRIPYQADYDYVNRRFLAVGRDGEDNTAIELYGRDIISPVRDYWFVPETDQGKNVAEYEVLQTANPPTVITMETAFGRLANMELGDYIRVNHFGGIGPGETRLYQIEEHLIMPGRRRVRVKAVDVEDLIDVVVAT